MQWPAPVTGPSQLLGLQCVSKHSGTLHRRRRPHGDHPDLKLARLSGPIAGAHHTFPKKKRSGGGIVGRVWPDNHPFVVTTCTQLPHFGSPWNDLWLEHSNSQEWSTVEGAAG